jgi:hypothetical protein
MVELTYLAVILIALAAMFFGYGFGWFEGRGKGYKKRKAEEEQEKQNQPPPQPEIVTETVTETVTVTVDDPGLLRLKNEGGAYTLDLDGTRVNPVALPPEQRKRLIEVLSIIRPWLEGRSAPASAATPSATTSSPPSGLLDRIQSAAASSSAPVQTPPASTPFRPAASVPLGSPPPTSPPASPQSASSPPPASQQPVAPPPASPQPIAAPKPATIAKDDRPSAPANSMVSQIDVILQARLIGTPLESRGIFLTQSPEGGVNVYVGLTRYGGIDEVPEPEIQAAIRAAITEWENKYTPGL